MRITPSRCALWVWAAACLPSCSVSDTSTGPTGPGQSFTSYISAVATAVVTYELNCDLLDSSRQTARTTQIQAAFPAYLTTAKDSSAMAGRTSYSAACVQNALHGAACSATLASQVLASCSGTEGSGRLATGRVCHLHDECQDGFCKGLSSSTQCGDGTCQPLGTLGAPCPEGPRACDPSGFVCQGGACFPLEGPGGVCNSDASCKSGLRCILPTPAAAQGACGTPVAGKPGDTCSIVTAQGLGCATGYACYTDATMAYRCQPIIALGQACSASGSCAPPGTCAIPTNQSTGTCTALGKPGATCNAAQGADCQSTLVCYALDANAQQVCTPLPDTGQSCDSALLPCLNGTCGAGQNGSLCQPLAGAGLSCQQNSDCASNLCSTTAGTCQSPACT